MGPLHRLVLLSWGQAGAGVASQVHFGISTAVSSTAESPVAPQALTAGNGFTDSNTWLVSAWASRDDEAAALMGAPRGIVGEDAG